MIKKWIGTVLLILLCYLLQTTIFHYFRLANVIPNLMLIMTVSTGYIRGRKDGLITGLICGLLSDVVFGSVIGLYGLIFMLIGFFSGYANIIYFKNNFWAPLILVGIGDFIYGFLFFVFEFLLRGKLNFITYFRLVILPEMIYTMLIAVLLYKLIWLVNKLTASIEGREEV